MFFRSLRTSSCVGCSSPDFPSLRTPSKSSFKLLQTFDSNTRTCKKTNIRHVASKDKNTTQQQLYIGLVRPPPVYQWAGLTFLDGSFVSVSPPNFKSIWTILSGLLMMHDGRNSASPSPAIDWLTPNWRNRNISSLSLWLTLIRLFR